MKIKKKINSFIKSKDKTRLIRDKIVSRLQRIWFVIQFRNFGKNSLIESPDRIIGKKYISIGDNVRILHHMRMEATDRWGEQNFSPSITIADNVSIGQNFHIVAANDLVIGANTTISGNVFITDNNHEYRKIDVHILDQPLKVNKTVIGENCFIGFGAAIQAGTVLGKQCIVGSNAVVQGQFEDYSVIVGCPAKVIKKYNLESGIWESISS